MKSSCILALIGVLTCFSALNGCGGDDDGDAESDEGPDLGKATGATCVSSLTYATDVAPLMTKYCTTCHAKSVTGTARRDAPADHNFETEAAVIEAAEHIDSNAGSGPSSTNTLMPPPAAKLPAPTAAERAIISNWLACQAK